MRLGECKAGTTRVVVTMVLGVLWTLAAGGCGKGGESTPEATFTPEAPKSWQDEDVIPVMKARLGIGNAQELAMSPVGDAVVVATSRGLFSFRFDTLEQKWESSTEGGQGSVEWSPGGDRLATAPFEGDVTIWDAETGEPRITLPETAAASALAWSPDGIILAVASGSAIDLWDAQTGERVNRTGAGPTEVESLAWSPDGKQLASGGDSGLTIWDASSAKRLQTLASDAGSMHVLTWSPDGHWLGSASLDRAIVWDPEAGKPLRTILEDYVGSLAWSPDGLILAYSSSRADVTVTLQDAVTGKDLLSFKREGTGIRDGVVDMAWSRDGTQVIAATYHEPLVIWDARTGEQLRSLGDHEGQVNDIAWSPEGDQLAAASDGGTIVVWDSRTEREVRSFADPSGRAFCVAWSPDGSRLASGGAGGAAIWDASMLERETTVPVDGDIVEGEGAYVEALAWSPDGTELAVGGEGDVVQIWDVVEGERMLSLANPGSSALIWLEDGNTLAADGWIDGEVVNLWNVRTGELLFRKQEVSGLSGSQGESLLASVATGEPGDWDNKMLVVWDAETHEELCNVATGRILTRLAWSPDGELLATGSVEGILDVWDARECRRVHAWQGDESVVSEVAWSPRGDLLANGSWDGTVKLWGLEAGRPGLEPAPSATSTMPAPPTSAPTPLPSPTPSPQAQIILRGEPPAWLKDPTNSVLAIVTGRDATAGQSTYQLSFVNAETGEGYDLTVPEAQGIFWADAQTFGLLSQDGQTLSFVDLLFGVVHAEAFDTKKFRLLSGTQPGTSQERPLGPMIPLLWVPTQGDGDSATLVADRGKYSSDLALYADGMDDVRVWESETAALAWDSDPEDDSSTSEVEFAWSPMEPHELAIVKGIYPDADKGGDYFDVEELDIVDVVGEEVLATYPGDFSSIQWSPKGDRLLYQTYEFNLLGSLRTPPCILQMDTRRHQCFPQVPDTHFPEDRAFIREVTSLHVFQWAKQGNAFYYLFQGAYYPPNVTDPGKVISIGGLCRYDLGSRHITCPTEGVKELEGEWIGWYHLSPDGHYAYMGTAETSPSLKRGVLDLGTGGFVELPYPSAGIGGLWRPMPGASPASEVKATRPTGEDVQGIPSIWNFFNLDSGLDLEGPGTREFYVDVTADRTFIWPFYWCAIDEDTLADNLKSTMVQFLIGEAQIPAEDILEYEHESERWACHYWATKLSDWHEGAQVLLTVKYGFRKAVNDGREEYRAGDYFYKLDVDVSGE